MPPGHAVNCQPTGAFVSRPGTPHHARPPSRSRRPLEWSTSSPSRLPTAASARPGSPELVIARSRRFEPHGLAVRVGLPLARTAWRSTRPRRHRGHRRVDEARPEGRYWHPPVRGVARRARPRPLRRQRSSEQLPEGHLRVNLDNPLIGSGQARDLKDAMPHPIALDAQLRPSARDTDRLGFLVGRRLQDHRREGRKDTRTSLANKLACCTISLPKRGLGRADRDVHTYRSRVRPRGHERGRIRRQASIVETSFVEDNGEPFSATGVETEGLHGAIVRPRQAQGRSGESET
jgi:hypothetical protein